MPDTDNPDLEKQKTSIHSPFASGVEGRAAKPIFVPQELEIYVNKQTKQTYMFHKSEVDYSVIDHLVYYPHDYSVDLVRKDKTRQDLGVKLQWLVRAHIKFATEVTIARMVDKKLLGETKVPLKIGEEKDKKFTTKISG